MFRVGTAPVKSHRPLEGGFSLFKQQLNWFSKTQQIFTSKTDIHRYNAKTLNILPNMIHNFSKESGFSERKTVSLVTEFARSLFERADGRIPSRHISEAIRQDAPILVESLIQAGADPDADTGDDNEEHKFPLSTAASLNALKHIACLHKCGAAMAIDSFQPLRIAVKHRKEESIKSLRRLGGCPNPKTLDHLTNQLMLNSNESDQQNIVECLCALHGVPKRSYIRIPYENKHIAIRLVISDGSEKYPHDFLGGLKVYNEINLL